jgi:uncharacterized membrane protein
MADYANVVTPDPAVQPDMVNYTHVIYALHATSVLIGLATSATVIGNFLFGIPSIIAVIMNYARMSSVRGTFLESHFRWQIRTFWFAALWTLITWAVSLPLTLVIIGFGTLFIGTALICLWIIYRVARGWLALRDRVPMPV